MFIIMEVTKTYMSNCKALMHVAKINSERLLVHKVIQLHRVFKIWPGLYTSINILKTTCHCAVSRLN